MGRDPGLNMNGTDLIPRILKLFGNKKAALLGTQSPYLERAARKIEDGHIKVQTLMDGYRKEEDYLRAVEKDRPPLVLLAMGMPKQERVANMLGCRLSYPCLVVCGGAILDFLGGKVSRAPAFMRTYGLEWLYRLALEPKRLFKRYVIGNFLMLARALRLSLLYRAARVKPETRPAPPLKILHVVRQFDPAVGGLEAYVKNMILHQKNAGCVCEVLTLNRVFNSKEPPLPGHETIEGIPVRRVGYIGGQRLFFPLIRPSFFKSFDIVHVHNTDMFFDYAGAVRARMKKPVFATTHGGFFHTKDFSVLKKIYFRTITRHSCKNYNAIFATSRNDYDTFKGTNGNLVLRPNAIMPLGDFTASGPDFIYIGRLAKHKNIAGLIEVFAALANRFGTEGNLHIVGPEWDVTKEELKALARRHAVEERVIFHGFVKPEGMETLLKKCGIFLSASAFEGFGMSMLEAMSVGLIPFVQPNESFRELIDAGQVGACVDFTQVQDAAEKIAALIPNIKPADRASAREYAAKFSWDELARNTMQDYGTFSG